MTARERHAHDLGMAAKSALYAAIADGSDVAWARLEDRIGTLEYFAGMPDADAELEFDGAPDTQEQVTTPPEVYAR